MQRTKGKQSDSLNYPVEILAGFAAGCLGGVVLLAAFLWILGRGEMASMRAALANPASFAFFAIWLAVGISTALIITAGFIAAARILDWKESRVRETQAGFLPVTGEETQEDTDEE